jgi:hypothetical protein
MNSQRGMSNNKVKVPTPMSTKIAANPDFCVETVLEHPPPPPHPVLMGGK